MDHEQMGLRLWTGHSEAWHNKKFMVYSMNVGYPIIVFDFL